MRLKHSAGKALVILPFLVLVANLSPAQSSKGRISQPIDSRRMSELRGNVSPKARAEFDQGVLAPTQTLNRVTMFFQRSAAQQQALDKLLQEQQDPSSPNYHKWLTPEQFAEQFGLASADVDKVKSWLTDQGFTVNEVARGHGWITFSGSAGKIAEAFRTELHQYAVNGSVHYANSTEPQVPAAIAGVVGGIRALNNFRPKPRAAIQKDVRPNFTSDISGNHFIAPDDFARIYDVNSLYAAGLDGTGQKIAVMGQTSILLADIATFRSTAGLPASVPSVVLVPGSGNPGVISDDLFEADLDIEWAGAVARNAQIIYVNSGVGAFDSLQYAADQNLAPVISISYGMCEADAAPSDFAFIDMVTQEAAAHGQTIVGPSGDSGATDCDYSAGSTPITAATRGLSVDIPAASPFVTGVGGTAFSEGSGSYWNSTNNSNSGSALFYIPETSWNDTASQITSGGSLSGSGGGASKHYSKPSWQVGTGVPADSARDVPDIAFNASFNHDGFIICSNGDCVTGFRNTDTTLDIVGGTSAGVPTFAGIVAILNQKMGAAQGSLNPRLYALAASRPYVFHDVTTGDNKSPCQTGTTDCPSGGSIGYSAGAGYDQVTGLGSVNAYNLVMNWDASAAAPGADFAVTMFDSKALTITRGGSATLPVILQSHHGFTGTVNLTCSVAGLTNTTCSVSSSSVNPDGAVTLTIATTATAALHPSGGIVPWWESTFGVAAFVGLGVSRRSKRQWLLLACVTAALCLGLMACGGGGSSSSSSSNTVTKTTGTQTGTVTVQAASGGISHSAQVSVTVN